MERDKSFNKIKKARVKLFQAGVVITEGVNGESINLKPGVRVVELKPKGVFRITNDRQNVLFTLSRQHMSKLVNTEETTDPTFQDTSR